MARRGEQRLRRRRFDDAPEIHDDDAIGQIAHDAEVVADEQIGEVERALQVHEQVQHLRLDRHVERGHRLVAYEELGLHGERAGDADARALAARELVRIAAHQRRIETDAVQHRGDVVAALRRAHETVRDRRLADDVDDAHARIERRIRILEDHLQLELLATRLSRCLSAKALAAPVALARGKRQQAGGEPSERRFAAAGFADEADHFAGMHGDVDVVDGVDDFLAHAGAEAIADFRREIERLDEALRRAAQLDQRRRCRGAGRTGHRASTMDATATWSG